MAYAAFSDVKTRAGRYAQVFEVAGKQPDEDTVEALLENVSDDLDAAISARGHTIPATDAAAAALVDTAAYGALSRALASVPSGDKGLDELKAFAEKMWTRSLEAIAGGKHAVILLLEAGSGGASAGNFWDDESTYGSPESIEAEARSTTPSLAPQFGKGQPL